MATIATPRYDAEMVDRTLFHAVRVPLYSVARCMETMYDTIYNYVSVN